jgi:uncharacterized protein YndB with AHSA1/START domain
MDVRIERVLKAPVSNVYAAWTRADTMRHWYCPNPALDLRVDADVRVGGTYVVAMGPHVVRGTYREVDPPRRLVFDWKWDEDDDGPSTVTVELSDAGEGTRMLLVHTGFGSAEEAANHVQAWEPTLDRLEQLLTP